MSMFDFKGAWTALVTPFNSDDSLDVNGLKKNIEFQIREGITGLLPVGTTGESPTLNWDEHNEVIDKTIKTVAGRVPCIAGVGSNNTAEAVRAAKHAQDIGADVGLLVDCYYNGPSSIELRTRYYEAVAKATPGFALVPYVIPGRSGCELSDVDVAILSQNPQFVAVKEATGNLDRMRRERSLSAKDFSIMSGDDDLTATMMTDPAIRSAGVISVMSNICPGAVTKMVKAFASGNAAAAKALEEKLKPLFALVTVKASNARSVAGQSLTVVDKYRNPLGVKTMMAGLGMPSGPARAPLGKMTAPGISVVRNALKAIRAQSPELLQPIADFYGVNVDARLADDKVWNALTDQR